MKTVKEYQKPEMEVVKLVATTSILAGSGETDTDPSGQGWSDED